MSQRDYLTIVSGLPRSGTSMMMRMIEQGGMPVLVDHLRTADDDNPNGYYEFEPVKKTKQDPSWVPGGVGKVVKMVHLLLLDLPLDFQYRVVFMRRHLDEVVKSQNVMLERHGDTTDDLPRERLIDIYRLQIKKVADYVDQHSDQFEMIEIDYNEMLRNPRPQAEMVSDLVDGLDLEAMIEVVDPKLYRNRVTS